MAMNPEIKKQWVSALRSRKYKQGRCWLRSEDKFCCLGVLCDLHAIATGGRWDGETYRGNAALPSDEVAIWADLDNQNPVVSIAGEIETLSGLNDAGKSFAQIADAIEASL